MRVCRHCGQVAPDPANEPICPGPDGLVTSHSYRDEEEQCVICGESRGPDGFEDGLRCKLCAEKEEGAAKPSDSLLPPPTPETGRPLSPEDPTR